MLKAEAKPKRAATTVGRSLLESAAGWLNLLVCDGTEIWRLLG